MANAYKVGQPVRVKTDVLVNGALTDATTMTCKVRKPKSRQLISAAATRDSLGRYSFIVSGAQNNEEGKYGYRFEGTGAGEGAGESAYVIEHSDVV